MQHLEVSCAVRRLYKSLGFKGLKKGETYDYKCEYTVSVAFLK